jgi:hypothetical protein
MNGNLPAIYYRPPVCGILSTTVPLIVAGFSYHVIHLLSVGVGEDGLTNIARFVVVTPVWFSIGIIFGIAGTFRRERFRALPWIGLILNSIPLCIMGLAVTSK